jgi:hypothetical protein
MNNELVLHHPPAKHRQRRQRDYNCAVALRPADIFHQYGISGSTLHYMCTHPDETKRLTSVLIPGRSGRRGVRLVYRADLEAYLARFKS